jgi:hypothetical protein
MALEVLQATLPAQSALAGTPGTNALHSIVATGATAGSFTLTYMGETTGPIPYNATAAQLATALQALPSVGANGVICLLGPLPTTAVTITWVGPLANTPQAIGVVGNNTVVGGTPTVTSTTTGVVAVGAVTELGVVPGANQPASSVSAIRLSTPTTVTGVAITNASIKVRHVRAGVVQSVLGGITFTAGVNLTAATPISLAVLTQPVSATGVPIAAQAGGATAGGPSSGEALQNLQAGDLIDVLQEQTGATGLALPVGVVAEVELF